MLADDTKRHNDIMYLYSCWLAIHVLLYSYGYSEFDITVAHTYTV